MLPRDCRRVARTTASRGRLSPSPHSPIREFQQRSTSRAPGMSCETAAVSPAAAATARDWLAGDPTATRLMEDVIESFAQALCNVIALVNPPVIVIGGGGALIGSPLISRLTASVRRQLLIQAVRRQLHDHANLLRRGGSPGRRPAAGVAGRIGNALKGPRMHGRYASANRELRRPTACADGL